MTHYGEERKRSGESGSNKGHVGKSPVSRDIIALSQARLQSSSLAARLARLLDSEAVDRERERMYRTKQDRKAERGHVCWKGRTCADSLLKLTQLSQWTFERIDSKIIIQKTP
jgi:hypothetical protein